MPRQFYFYFLYLELNSEIHFENIDIQTDMYWKLFIIWIIPIDLTSKVKLKITSLVFEACSMLSSSYKLNILWESLLKNIITILVHFT